MPTQAVFYRAPDGAEPVAEFLDDEFPVEPRKKKPSARELQAAASKRVTVDLQIDRLNGLAEIEIVKERWQDFKDRMEARPRKRPRAAGGDAP
jgi:hypothetical protein